jgi:lipid-A-disaccharide synthase-like uncharacterized protein
MLANLAHAVGDYLYNVFVLKLSWIVVVGFAGQLMFSARFIVQWIASERARKSVIPVTFWFFSIGGGLLSFAYALTIKDPVFILGQGFGVFVYLRNLYFVYLERRSSGTVAAA